MTTHRCAAASVSAMGCAHAPMITISTPTDTYSMMPGKPTMPTAPSAPPTGPHKINIGGGSDSVRSEDLWCNGKRKNRVEVGDYKGEAKGKSKQLDPVHDETSFKRKSVNAEERERNSPILCPSYSLSKLS